MPGIICSIYNNNQPNEQFKQQVDLASDYHSKLETESIVENGFHIAVIKPQWLKAKKCLLVNDDYIFAFYGSVYDSNYTNQLNNHIQLIDILFSRYKQHGIEALEDLNGNYVIALWHKKSRKFNFISDRFGTQRHYWSKQANRFSLSCELKTIACTSSNLPTINQTALGSMLTLGYHIGELTLINNIQRTPNACHLKYDANKNHISIQQYWDYPYTGYNKTTKSEKQLIDEMYQTLLQGTKSRCEQSKKVLLPLSGGLDSRTVAGLLKQCALERDIHTFSYGNNASQDQCYAKKIAQILDYPFQSLKTPTGYLTDYLEKTAWQFDAETCGEYYYTLYAHLQTDFPYNESTALLSGLYGDIVCGSDKLRYQSNNFRSQPTNKEPLIPITLVDTYLKRHCEYGNLNSLNYFFSPQAARNIKEELTEILLSQCNDFTDVSFFNALRRLEFINRQFRRTIFITQAVEYDIEPITPFLDKNFVDFMIQLPQEFIYDKYLYKKMIIKHLPDLAKISYSNTGLPLSDAPIKEALSWRKKRFLQQNPKLNKWLLSRKTNFNFSDSIAKDQDFFLSQQSALQSISPPCAEKLVNNSFQSILSGNQGKYDQVLAILPPCYFFQNILSKHQFLSS